MNVFNDHRKLYSIAGLLFFGLTYLVVIMPALQNQNNNAPLPNSKKLTAYEKAGKLIYISEGCVGCHSQQVRNVDMDKVFGTRPGMASDYANIGRTSILQNTATLMGTERTGPDLTNIGIRQTNRDWHLMHLYNPRSVVAESIMPSYEWLFEYKETPNKNDVIVAVPPKFLSGKTGKVVATTEAMQLVAYLQSLQQAPLPTGQNSLEFLYKNSTKENLKKGSNATGIDGQTLYVTNCQACHQASGEGIKGSFPPLKGSKIVNGDNLDLYVDIIMNGYDARPEYGVMAAVGTNMNFTEHEVAAIINYERNTWGNNGKQVTSDEIKKIMDFIKIKASAK